MSLRQELDQINQQLSQPATYKNQALLKQLLKKQIELKKIISQGPTSHNKIICEIRAGTGGDEATLFAGDLFRMYGRLAEKQGWQTELIDKNSTTIGGFKEIVFSIQGKNVYTSLKNESGVHRVQRIPATEKIGRIHTSTASVAILPEAKKTDVKINTQDLRIDTYRATGPGGQHLNVTDSAVRITHLPTGLVVTSQAERSQIKNRAQAMSVLRTRLWQQQKQNQHAKLADKRRQQIGTADRSEKIRTYNFPQDRVTDHRLKKSWHGLENILNGNLEKIITSFKK